MFCGKPGSLLPLCPGLVHVVGCHREGTLGDMGDTAVGDQQRVGIDFLME